MNDKDERRGRNKLKRGWWWSSSSDDVISKAAAAVESESWWSRTGGWIWFTVGSGKPEMRIKTSIKHHHRYPWASPASSRLNMIPIIRFDEDHSLYSIWKWYKCLDSWNSLISFKCSSTASVSFISVGCRSSLGEWFQMMTMMILGFNEEFSSNIHPSIDVKSPESSRVKISILQHTLSSSPSDLFIKSSLNFRLNFIKVPCHDTWHGFPRFFNYLHHAICSEDDCKLNMFWCSTSSSSSWWKERY